MTHHPPARIEIQPDRLGQIFEQMSAGVVVLDGKRRIVAMNPWAESVTHTDTDHAKGQSCRALLADRLCDGHCPDRECMAHTDCAEFQPPVGDGPPKRLLRISAPATVDGDDAGAIAVFQDMSAYSELIERIGMETRKLKEILDHLDIGILTCDRGGHVTFFNTTAERITGRTRQEVLGAHCQRYFPETFYSADDQDSGTIGATEPETLEIPTARRQPIPVQVRQFELTQTGGKSAGRLITFSDVTLVRQYKKVLTDRYTFHDMVSAHPCMEQVFEMAAAVAATSVTVLIDGASGTGKGLMANVIHSASQRADGPLVKVNCAALPENLLESEMFGYAKGAFTGADRDKPGRFHDADGGTLFLDEIGDMPLSLQAKLLRVLEAKEFYPLGSRQPSRVDVRIVAATNRDLTAQVKQGLFREDLYYRLNVMRVTLPALADRRSDIPLLIEHILAKLSLVHAKQVNAIANDAMAILLNHEYPGNVRELENILEHAMIITQSPLIERRHLPMGLQAQPDPPANHDEAATRHTAEREHLLQALASQHWHRGRTAAAMGMDRTTLWRKMKRLGITEVNRQ